MARLRTFHDPPRDVTTDAWSINLAGTSVGMPDLKFVELVLRHEKLLKFVCNPAYGFSPFLLCFHMTALYAASRRPAKGLAYTRQRKRMPAAGRAGHLRFQTKTPTNPEGLPAS